MEEKDVVETTAEENESSDELKTYDAEYVKKLKAEAKEYRQSKAALKKQFEEVQAKLDAIEAEKLTDAEKKQKRIEEFEKQLGEIASATKQKDIDNMVLKAISGKPIVDVEAAMMLIHKELAGEDELDDAAVAKVVENVLKTKPYLISNEKQNISAGNFGKQDNDPAKNPDAMFGDFLRS